MKQLKMYAQLIFVASSVLCSIQAMEKSPVESTRNLSPASLKLLNALIAKRRAEKSKHVEDDYVRSKGFCSVPSTYSTSIGGYDNIF